MKYKLNYLVIACLITLITLHGCTKEVVNPNSTNSNINNSVKPSIFLIPNEDSLALVNLYNNTGGDNWTNHKNWLTSAPISQWYGVGLDKAGKVDTLFLANNNLTGSIGNNDIALLNYITILDIHGNNLVGVAIPENSLNTLTYLDLSSSIYLKNFTYATNSLSNLQFLDIHMSLINSFQVLPNSLNNLNSLDISQTYVPSFIVTENSLQNIASLNISHGALTTFTPLPYSLNKLVFLDLSLTKLDTFVIPNSTFTNLQKIYLGSTSIRNIKISANTLNNLSVLDASGLFQLETFFVGTHSLTSIRAMSFAYSYLYAFHFADALNESLTSLNFSNSVLSNSWPQSKKDALRQQFPNANVQW